MKKAIALIAAAVMILTLFSACGDKIITDKEGNTHKIVTQKGGEPAQDEYGNLIEEVTNDNNEKVTQPVSYPEVTQTGKNEIQDAYFILEIPKDWYFDSEINKFRIQHDDESKKRAELCARFRLSIQKRVMPISFIKTGSITKNRFSFISPILLRILRSLKQSFSELKQRRIKANIHQAQPFIFMFLNTLTPPSA